MSEDEIKAALSVKIEFNSDMCGTDSYAIKLFWNDEEISSDSVEIYD